MCRGNWMSSTIGSYMTPISGLYTSQVALNVVTNNVSNVNTEGYTRQQTITCDQARNGVDVQQIRQIRDFYLDNSYRTENSSLGYWEATEGVVNDVEIILGTFSESGFYSSIDDFFHAWEELSKDPESLVTRSMVVEYGVAFVDIANQINEQLINIQEDACNQIVSMVDEINQLAQDIAELNEKIMECQAMGLEANEYKDQRNLLIDQLSYNVDINVVEKSDGMVNISVGGTYLVNGNKSNKMEVEILKSDGDYIEIKWENSGDEVKAKNGALKGLMKCVEDSENVISGVSETLDTLIYTMATELNNIHLSGFGLDGSTGIDFFIPTDSNNEIGLGNIQVNPEFDDLNNVAASESGEPGDSKIAMEILDFRNRDCFTYDGYEMNIDDYYTSFTAWIGTVGEEATNFASNQSTLINQVQAQRGSVSGVSMDEEMSNMIIFQTAYNANAKVISAIDEMVDTLINKMGV